MSDAGSSANSIHECHSGSLVNLRVASSHCSGEPGLTSRENLHAGGRGSRSLAHPNRWTQKESISV